MNLRSATTRNFLLSTSQVATALGVSRRTVARLCDRGLIASSRVLNGPRKITIGNLIRLARDKEVTVDESYLSTLVEGAGV